MKFIIVAFALCVAIAFAAPGSPEAEAIVKSQDAEIAPDHSRFKHGYSTSNGIIAHEQGLLRQPKTVDETAAYETQGQFQYVGPDNIIYAVRYTAGVGGFQPEVHVSFILARSLVVWWASIGSIVTQTYYLINH